MATPRPLTDEERANLVAFLDGELDPAASAVIEAKLALNPLARAEADELRRTWSLLDYLPRPQTSPEFTHQTLERLMALSPTVAPARPGWRVWIFPAGWTAALIVATALGVVGGKWLHRS